jgi:hypothetical protein
MEPSVYGLMVNNLWLLTDTTLLSYHMAAASLQGGDVVEYPNKRVCFCLGFEWCSVCAVRVCPSGRDPHTLLATHSLTHLRGSLKCEPSEEVCGR